ncbi:MAG TPA: ATP-binding cassette domain-containing protein, partial [Solirubrobacteraceae bacterium]|nr:ATP-binding cassette domain-containing protein [Solirubrobacteraceae bacterium]
MPERNVQHSLQRAAFGLEDDGLLDSRASARAQVLDQPVVIEVTDVHKSFRVPERKRELTKLQPAVYRNLRVLRGISFDVHRGEFFGIVGRNGSGKSTLLKILASIYKADSGRIRI